MKYFIIIVTGLGDWGKGRTLAEAMKNAKLKTLPKRDCQVAVKTALFSRDTTDEELEKLMTYWGCNAFGSVMRCDDLTPEEHELINQRCIGWLSDDSFM